MSVKDDAIVALGKRIRGNNSTPDVFYNDQAIDKKKLRRHITATEKKLSKEEESVQLRNKCRMASLSFVVNC